MTARGRAATLEITHSAEHDFLTGLPNRTRLNDRNQPGDRGGASS